MTSLLQKLQLSKKQAKSEQKHFSDYFPYTAGDFRQGDPTEECSELYLLKDGSVMRLYECTSLVLANEQTFDTLTNIVKISWPVNTVIQTILLSDDYIDPILQSYSNLRSDNMGLFREQTSRLSAHYRKGIDGMPQMSGNPIRNFRLFVAIRIPVKAAPFQKERSKEIKEYVSLLNDVESYLNGMKVAPVKVAPSAFITLLHSIVNPDLPRTDKSWDIFQTLDKQVLYADTPVNIGNDYMQFGKTYASCLTPKTYPKEVDFFTANSLIGLMSGTKSNEDDNRQIRCKFIYTLNIIKSDLKQTLLAKGKQVEIQQAAGSIAPGVNARKEEYRWAFTAMEKGDEFIQVIPVLWLFHEDKDRLDMLSSDVKSIWKASCDMESQREQDYLLPKLFIGALPGGIDSNDIARLQRDWIMPTNAASRFAALNGGYKGKGEPYLLFIDRRGQLTGFDFFNTAANRNILITGGSGGGKSFLMNYIVSSYYSCGHRIRIIDVGESYSKLTYLVDGTYIYPLKERIIVNFFETLKLPDFETTDMDDDEAEAVMGTLAMLTSIIATMAYSRTSAAAVEHEKVLIELAIKQCYKQYHQNTSIDDIAQFLDTLSEFYKKRDEQAQIEHTPDKYIESIRIGHFLSESLQKFTSTGEYGRFFNGKSNISLDNQLVVTELNNLPDDLKKVLVLAVASIISDEVYRGTSHPTLILLDEAWQTLSENQAAADFVEGLYRKVRKHNGGVGIATQSVMDLDAEHGKLRFLGNVLTSQSSYHFIILDQKFHKAVEAGIIDVSEFETKFYYDRMPDAKSIGYKYSEIFIKGVDGASAVVRLQVDPFTYLLNTSDPNEKDYIVLLTEKFKSEGLDRKDALFKAIVQCADMIDKLGGTGPFAAYIKNELLAYRKSQAVPAGV